MNVLGTIQAFVAIVPAVILLCMIYKCDKVEAEPIKLIVITFVLGALSAIPILIVEIIIGEWIGWLEGTSFLGTLIYMCIGVALVEEFFKLCAVGPAWKSKHFNYTFDGVVYCATAALGYACLENILYIVGDASWAQIAMARGLLSVPGHMCDGIFMGVFLGMAKFYSVRGQKAQCTKMVLFALGAPILEHMIYDTLCGLESSLPLLAWAIIVYVLAFVAVAMTWKKNDKPIYMVYAPAAAAGVAPVGYGATGYVAPSGYGMPAGAANYGAPAGYNTPGATGCAPVGAPGYASAPAPLPHAYGVPQNWQSNPAYFDNPRHPYAQPQPQPAQIQRPQAQQPPFQQ